MALFRLKHDLYIDKFLLGIAYREIDDFIFFLESRQDFHPVVSQMMDLLIPARKIIEIQLNDESSIKEVIEVAFCDFNEAIKLMAGFIEEHYASQLNA